MHSYKAGHLAPCAVTWPLRVVALGAGSDLLAGSLWVLNFPLRPVMYAHKAGHVAHMRSPHIAAGPLIVSCHGGVCGFGVTAGGVQVPSRICRPGQYARRYRENGLSGAGSQLR